MPDGLLIVVLASALYAVAISFGMPREFDNRAITRPIIVAGGLAIVIVVKEWGDWDEMGMWFIWLGIAAVPQVLRVAVIHVQEERKKNLQRHAIDPGKSNDNATSS